MNPTKIITATTPVVVAAALYFVLRYIGMPDWMALILSVSTALAMVSFLQSINIANRSGTRYWRSPALRKFGSDFFVSAMLAAPIAALLHVRFLFLTYGLGSVFDSRGWTGWLDTGGGYKTILFAFVVALGVMSFARLVIRRFTKKKMT